MWAPFYLSSSHIIVWSLSNTQAIDPPTEFSTHLPKSGTHLIDTSQQGNIRNWYQASFNRFRLLLLRSQVIEFSRIGPPVDYGQWCLVINPSLTSSRGRSRWKDGTTHTNVSLLLYPSLSDQTDDHRSSFHCSSIIRLQFRAFPAYAWSSALVAAWISCCWYRLLHAAPCICTIADRTTCCCPVAAWICNIFLHHICGIWNGITMSRMGVPASVSSASQDTSVVSYYSNYALY